MPKKQVVHRSTDSTGSAKSTGMKRRGRSGSSPKTNKTADDTPSEDVKVINTNELSENTPATSEEPIARKRPKRVAACSDFKEKSLRLHDKSSKVEIKKNRVEEEEIVAVDLTKLGPEDTKPCRKLLDFILHDSDGSPVQFEMSEIDDCWITAIIVPMDEDLEKVKGSGVKCEGFGRVESWSISGYDEGTAVVWVATEIADYECVKPSGKYKKFYDHFHEKARICVEVYRKIAKPVGGNPSLSLEELIAGIVRSMSAKSFSGGSISRDFVISLGEFIYKQLAGLEDSENDGESLDAIPALIALRDECKNKASFNRFPPKVFSGSLKIQEGDTVESIGDEDAKLAQLLQEEEEWKMMKQQSRRPVSSQNNIYIKISEEEIANDYPLPAYYKPIVQEMDEFLFFESDSSMGYSDLPRRVLQNWSLYNSDSRLISLELLPMKQCAEVDVAAFGSGNMSEDDGSGYYVETDPGLSSSSASNSADIEGVPIYLSAIKEWMIEFGSSMIFISVRTDVAWYRLGKPTKQYAPWYEPVLKTARLAISIITLLKEESRVSKLSFVDVLKKVSDFKKDHNAYISSDVVVVERYVVVHGQIILQQFAEYPDETIRKSAFVTRLSEKMEQRRHTKLFMKKKVAVKKEENMNPSAAMGPALSKRKVMRATTTRLINRIWGDYYSNNFPEDTKEEDANEPKEVEEEQEDNEEEEVEDENASIKVEDEKVSVNEVNDEKSPKSRSSTKSAKSKAKASDKEIKWEGEPTGKMDSGETLYRCAIVRGDVIAVGGAVTIESEESEEVPAIYFVEYMFKSHEGMNMAHGRMMVRGSETILGNAANERELFLTNDCMDFDLEDIKKAETVDIRLLSWGHTFRKEYYKADMIDRAKAEERKKKGLAKEYYCKSLYVPEKGAFFTLPSESLAIGSGYCDSCKQRESEMDEFNVKSKTSFVYNKIEYAVHDFVYVSPEFFTDDKEYRGTFKSGRNVGLKAYAVCHLLSIEVPTGSKQPTPTCTKVKVRRFYRPEDVSAEKAYSSDIREVYYSEELLNVPVEMIEGRCEVRKKHDLLSIEFPVAVDHIFFCEYSYDATKGALKKLPVNVKLTSVTRERDTIPRKNKGKGKCLDDQDATEQLKDVSHENCLATLDIFAGCGGLSEGLQRSGASVTKWAIEYEQPAGEAFSQNHPDTLMFIDNCNVILRAIMEKCGDTDDCIATPEADDLAAKLDEEKLKNLPMPGQVDFINGGPPCQGFSGMNRFNQSTWSKVQCEMILAFLSFAEYFRPKFFLLENVRNFVSFNKGQTFRLTVASLLEMGYQVRFGILEAGTFGVSQSRKRAFIWAAAPGELLPEWPEPMHVFASPELKISLPGDSHYAAARSTAGGAPFRSITVRDTIGDLPPIQNGASKLTVDYGSEPISWFQKQIRGRMMGLNDHISKEMNELNLIRCQHIPKRPGADWQDLPAEKVKLSNGQMVDLIPWCLPNTAKRHNQWKGLFGRLDWEGNFPTSITDPQPMGKVGMCFHPDQDRILSVRECARSQGFPDSYLFAGNIQNKHRQIGNAVPPPLAYALGRKLKEAVDTKNQTSQ